MSLTWDGAHPPPHSAPGFGGWLHIVRRGALILLVLAVGLLCLFAIRLVERPLYGRVRPWSPWITRICCRIGLWAMGLHYVRRGRPMAGQGAVVANHTGWLDIFALNASDKIYFVSKAEVARWPGIGFLARAVGTVFIARDRRQAAAQADLFEDRLRLGHRLLFFPEGTSTDGLRVLPFKPTLFAAFFVPGLRETLWVQPVSVAYHAPEGYDPKIYGWWGDMSFDAHLLATLAMARQGRVEVVYHPPLEVAAFADRKALARAAEEVVRTGHSLAEGRST